MNYVSWILILLCAANFLTNFAYEDSEMRRSEDFLISSKDISLSDLKVHDLDSRKPVESENFNVTEKAHRGKGSYGGANVVHRRPDQKNAAMLYGPCFFISSIVLGYSFSLLLAYPFISS